MPDYIKKMDEVGAMQTLQVYKEKLDGLRTDSDDDKTVSEAIEVALKCIDKSITNKIAKKHGHRVYECPICFCFHVTKKDERKFK